MSRFHCLKCNEDAVYVYANDGHHFGCNGRVIPIATLCSEPTVIDESDIAPGMVVVAVDDTQPLDAWVSTPDAGLDANGLVYMCDGCHLSDTRLGDRHDVEGWIRRIAGVRP